MSEIFHENRIIKSAKLVVVTLSAIRLVPHIALFLLSPTRDILYKDLDRFADAYDPHRPDTVFRRVIFFIKMMTFIQEYRNVFYFRHKILGHLLAFLCPPMRSLRIYAGTCGPGLFVHHGFGTMITAKEIGANFTVRQLATVGFANNDMDCPKIGDNVTIGVGARVLGGVTIGDEVVVAANSLVIADVPPGVTVMGVPTKIVSRRTTGNPEFRVIEQQAKPSTNSLDEVN